MLANRSNEALVRIPQVAHSDVPASPQTYVGAQNVTTFPFDPRLRRSHVVVQRKKLKRGLEAAHIAEL